MLVRWDASSNQFVLQPQMLSEFQTLVRESSASNPFNNMPIIVTVVSRSNTNNPNNQNAIFIGDRQRWQIHDRQRRVQSVRVVQLHITLGSQTSHPTRAEKLLSTLTLLLSSHLVVLSDSLLDLDGEPSVTALAESFLEEQIVDLSLLQNFGRRIDFSKLKGTPPLSGYDLLPWTLWCARLKHPTQASANFRLLEDTILKTMGDLEDREDCEAQQRNEIRRSLKFLRLINDPPSIKRLSLKLLSGDLRNFCNRLLQDWLQEKIDPIPDCPVPFTTEWDYIRSENIGVFLDSAVSQLNEIVSKQLQPDQELSKLNLQNFIEELCRRRCSSLKENCYHIHQDFMNREVVPFFPLDDISIIQAKHDSLVENEIRNLVFREVSACAMCIRTDFDFNSFWIEIATLLEDQKEAFVQQNRQCSKLTCNDLYRSILQSLDPEGLLSEEEQHRLAQRMIECGLGPAKMKFVAKLQNELSSIARLRLERFIKDSIQTQTFKVQQLIQDYRFANRLEIETIRDQVSALESRRKVNVADAQQELIEQQQILEVLIQDEDTRAILGQERDESTSRIQEMNRQHEKEMERIRIDQESVMQKLKAWFEQESQALTKKQQELLEQQQAIARR